MEKLSVRNGILFPTNPTEQTGIRGMTLVDAGYKNRMICAQTSEVTITMAVTQTMILGMIKLTASVAVSPSSSGTCLEKPSGSMK